MATARHTSTSGSGTGRAALFVAVAAILQLTLLTGPAAAACHIAAFSQESVEVEESAGEITLAVVLQGSQPSCEGTVDYTTDDGTAVAGEDYGSASGTLTFTQGDDREETIVIPVLTDDASEGDEQFRVVLSNATGTITATGDPATVTITDAAAGQDGTDEPATEEPATEEPATEDPATEEPAAEDPATDAPTEEPEPVEDQFPWVPVAIVLLVLVGAGVAFAMRGNRPAG